MIGWLQWYYLWEIVSFRVHFGTLVPTFSLFKNLQGEMVTGMQ
jgi:hypothetical protein